MRQGLSKHRLVEDDVRISLNLRLFVYFSPLASESLGSHVRKIFRIFDGLHARTEVQPENDILSCFFV